MAVTKKQDKLIKKDKDNGKEAAKKGNGKDVAKKKAVIKTGRFEQSKVFFRGVINELKKVHWPNRKEITIYTAVVVVTVVFIAALIGVFDFILGQVMNALIK